MGQKAKEMQAMTSLLKNRDKLILESIIEKIMNEIEKKKRKIQIKPNTQQGNSTYKLLS